jgi:hypothetical protein
MDKKFKPLDLDKLNDKKSIIVSSEKALEDISAINWATTLIPINKGFYK